VALDARSVSVSDIDFTKCINAVIKVLFKNQQTVTFEDVWNLKETLRTNLWDYEFFNMEPDENGTISMEDFLSSVLSNVSPQKVTLYQKQC